MASVTEAWLATRTTGSPSGIAGARYTPTVKLAAATNHAMNNGTAAAKNLALKMRDRESGNAKMNSDFHDDAMGMVIMPDMITP